MEPKQWIYEYSIGVRELDEQHQQLFALHNELIELTERNLVDRELVGQTLDRLVEYTEKHFQTEERLLDKYAYPDPDLEQHKQHHREFLIQIMKWMNAYLDGNDDLLPAIIEHISNWLIHHILNEDKRYYHYFLYSRQSPNDMSV